MHLACQKFHFLVLKCTYAPNQILSTICIMSHYIAVSQPFFFFQPRHALKLGAHLSEGVFTPGGASERTLFACFHALFFNGLLYVHETQKCWHDFKNCTVHGTMCSSGCKCTHIYYMHGCAIKMVVNSNNNKKMKINCPCKAIS